MNREQALATSRSRTRSTARPHAVHLVAPEQYTVMEYHDADEDRLRDSLIAIHRPAHHATVGSRKVFEQILGRDATPDPQADLAMLEHTFGPWATDDDPKDILHDIRQGTEPDNYLHITEDDVSTYLAYKQTIEERDRWL